MLDAFIKDLEEKQASDPNSINDQHYVCGEAYKAMLSAAPRAAKGER